MDEKQTERKILEKKLTIIQAIVVALCFLWVFASSWLGEGVFAYEVTKTKTVKESYEYVTGTVSTYVCYTTRYGDCYHAGYCGYLWNSSYKTTVYQAEKQGYDPCSKCTPTERTVLELTETRYRDVEKTETITKEPSLTVWIIGTCGIVLVYRVSTKGLRKRIDSLNTNPLI